MPLRATAVASAAAPPEVGLPAARVVEVAFDVVALRVGGVDTGRDVPRHPAVGVGLVFQVAHVGTALPALVGPVAVAHVGGGRAGMVAAVDNLAVPGDLLGLIAQPGRVEQVRRVVADPDAVAAKPPVTL